MKRAKMAKQKLYNCFWNIAISEESGLNIKDNNRFTALMVACKNGHIEIIKLFLDSSERNIDLNARNNEGTIAFTWACRNGHKDVVQLLLDNSERNIDLNARCVTGRTALMYANIYGHKDVVKLIYPLDRKSF